MGAVVFLCYSSRLCLRNGVACQLIPNEYKARCHQGHVGCKGVPLDTSRPPPEAHGDQDCAEGEQLPNLDADVERNDIRNKSIAGQRKFLQFRGETESMEEAED